MFHRNRQTGAEIAAPPHALFSCFNETLRPPYKQQSPCVVTPLVLRITLLFISQRTSHSFYYYPEQSSKHQSFLLLASRAELKESVIPSTNIHFSTHRSFLLLNNTMLAKSIASLAALAGLANLASAAGPLRIRDAIPTNVDGSQYNSATAGPPSAWFAGDSSLPVSKILAAVACMTTAQQDATYSRGTKMSKNATIHSDWANFSKVREER